MPPLNEFFSSQSILVEYCRASRARFYRGGFQINVLRTLRRVGRCPFLAMPLSGAEQIREQSPRRRSTANAPSGWQKNTISDSITFSFWILMGRTCLCPACSAPLSGAESSRRTRRACVAHPARPVAPASASRRRWECWTMTDLDYDSRRDGAAPVRFGEEADARRAEPPGGSVGAEFLKLYPRARIFVAGKEHFESGKRRAATARIATGNFDAVIVSHRSCSASVSGKSVRTRSALP